ncbi:hypothetical protein CN692_03035 [Bacillus sp. AFS002410]|uniref:DUF1572 family protein n=1 Tax=Bacillus sp. AFS002410 TaxID=2033481 RepID=UPI000BF021AC|nr:DUF1572 family protein [Bacillus sp. AFS002410]PEJ60282.1 hypothetical protein CN692_03035 [Bacillus sp. AFS002410]
MSIAKQFLSNSLKEFQGIKKLGDRSIDQLDNEELHWHPTSESNSISIIVKHLSGNMISRFTDFMTTDGEKPWRNRDVEFEGNYKSKDDLLTDWNKGWNVVFNTIESLKEEDVLKTVKIRGEEHTVLQAIHRQISHYGYHIGQIVYISKQIKNEKFTSLSIPKGKSQQFLEFKLNEANKSTT